MSHDSGLSPFSPPGLHRFRQTMKGFVDRGDVPGLVTAVSRHGETHIDAFGMKQVGGSDPMRADTIFRIASLTKPIAAAAVMILVEECKLRLDEPVDRWLPELANRRVLRSIESSLDDTTPAERPITVRDVLTYCMGFGSVMAMPDTYPIQVEIRERAIGGDGPPQPDLTPGTDEWLRRLGELPLMYQPGSRWLYHVSGDVQGALVERVSGQTFESFLRERIFEPLGMVDTAFSVPAHKLDRFATSYYVESGQLGVYDDARTGQWSRSPAFQSGGGGLVSTASDYLAFCHLMLNKGKAGGERVLSRASVELMTSDQLTPDQRIDTELFLGEHSSWGFGMSVDIRRDNLHTVPRRFGWDGGLGTSGYSDPHENLVGVLLTQRMADSPEAPPVYADFWTSVYQAIE